MIIQKRFLCKVIFPVLILLSCLRGAPGTAPSARMEQVLGTLCRIDLFESGSARLYQRLFARLAALDAALSATRDDSELAALNRNAGIAPLPVSPELFAVLDRARFFAGLSGGAFDPSVGPLVRLWNTGGTPPRIPSEPEIDAALDLVRWEDLELSPGPERTAFLKRRGMALDLGAIAKGYAADELVRILREEEVPRALIDLGGNIYVWGIKSGGGPWRVGIQNPLDERGSYAGILELPGGMSAVTSGVYERYITGSDGQRYHHILDPRAEAARPGYPADNGLLSVTIAAAVSMDADALSTACFVLGYEKGRALAETLGAEALFIFAGKTIRGTAGALEAFTLSDNGYDSGYTVVKAAPR